MKLPQVSLRELFLLVVIAAMGCGWWVERGRPKREADMWEKHARYWRGNAEALARDILTVDPTWSTTFDGIPPTPSVAHEPAMVFVAGTPPNITEAELMEMKRSP